MYYHSHNPLDSYFGEHNDPSMGATYMFFFSMYIFLTMKLSSADWNTPCSDLINRNKVFFISLGSRYLVVLLKMVTVNLGILHYVLDHVYGALVHRNRLTTPFFSRGWGGSKLDLLESMIKQLFPEIIGQETPSLVQPLWRTVWESRNASLREGVFRTPCSEELMSALPPESRNARVAFLAPKFVQPQKMACVVHLAGIDRH